VELRATLDAHLQQVVSFVDVPMAIRELAKGVCHFYVSFTCSPYTSYSSCVTVTYRTSETEVYKVWFEIL